MAIASTQKPPRIYPSANVVMAIRTHIQMASPKPYLGQRALTVGKAVPIGTLPAGALVLPPAKHTRVAFNGTTPKVLIGTETDDDAFSGTAALDALGFLGGIADGAALGYLAAETVVYAKLTGTGSITAGEVVFLLPFYGNAD
jgi:hypothetical protein